MTEQRLKSLSLACAAGALMYHATLAAAEAREVSLGEVGNAAEVAEDRADDILVSARKQPESILNVPVVETVISAEKLEQMQILDVRDIQKYAPGLTLGHGTPNVGALVAIRGVGPTSQDPGVDQSVSLNIDGITFSQGVSFQAGLFDAAQVEVLKGPQALFYGKSSPGGVIAVRTADPTDRFELILRGGYEIESRGGRGELIVSGPLSPTLKARLAASYSKAEGYFRNVSVALPQFGATPPAARDPRPESLITRATLLWDPSTDFQVRLKGTYTYDRLQNATTAQLASCPDGPGEAPLNIPFIGGEDCRLDRNLRIVSMDPAFFPGIENGGVPFTRIEQAFGSMEISYKGLAGIELSSTTGYYDLRTNSLANANPASAAGPTFGLSNALKRHEFTEELRATSNFDGPVNFTLGGFFQDGQLAVRGRLIGNSAYRLPASISNNLVEIKLRAYSLFGQLRWQIMPQLELSGGLRWTDETRREQVTNLRPATPTVVAVPRPRIHSANVSPDITLTYKPTDDITIFSAYRKAYKSGSFSTSVQVGTDNSFGDERVSGFEAGLKSRLFDRQLNFNIAGYIYRYSGLQVGASQQQGPGLPPVVTVINAASAKSYGVELDARYSPDAIEGLSLNAAVSWNRANFKTFLNAPCYGGQTIAQGCNQVQNPSTQLFTAQNLSGSPLVRAPEWQAALGLDYKMPVGRDMKLGFGTSSQISSKFLTVLAAGRPGTPPDSYQRAFVKTDLSLTLYGPNDTWTVSVIGKNITDKVTAGNCSAVNVANGVLLGGQTTGGVTNAPAGGLPNNSEMSCYSDPGREIWLRLSYRFGG